MPGFGVLGLGDPCGEDGQALPWGAPGSIPPRAMAVISGDRDYREWVPEAKFRGPEQALPLAGDASDGGETGCRGRFEPCPERATAAAVSVRARTIALACRTTPPCARLSALPPHAAPRQRGIRG